jgi:hypothetical protein
MNEDEFNRAVKTLSFYDVEHVDGDVPVPAEVLLKICRDFGFRFALDDGCLVVKVPSSSRDLSRQQFQQILNSYIMNKANEIAELIETKH